MFRLPFSGVGEAGADGYVLLEGVAEEGAAKQVGAAADYDEVVRRRIRGRRLFCGGEWSVEEGSGSSIGGGGAGAGVGAWSGSVSGGE